MFQDLQGLKLGTNELVKHKRKGDLPEFASKVIATKNNEKKNSCPTALRLRHRPKKIERMAHHHHHHHHHQA